MAAALSPTPPDQPPEPVSRHPRQSRRNRVRLWAVTTALAVVRLVMVVRARTEANRADESGNVITDNLAWIVFGIVAIVVIGALIKTLGSNVLNWVQTQLGIS